MLIERRDIAKPSAQIHILFWISQVKSRAFSGVAYQFPRQPICPGLKLSYASGGTGPQPKRPNRETAAAP